MRNSQSPSIYSVFSNALPFYLDRADIHTLSDEGDDFTSRFLQQLLQRKDTLQLDASVLAADKLRHLYFESRNLEKTSGARTLGFGYPHMVDTFEGELMVAPIFIWLLPMEPAQGKVDSWIFRFDEQIYVQPNFQVIEYLKEKFDYDCRERMTDMAKGQLSLQTLRTFCTELAERFHFDIKDNEQHLLAAPGIDEISSFTEHGTLHMSGVLALFPPQYYRWKHGAVKPEDVFADVEEVADEDAFLFPFLPADPEQVTALEHISHRNITVVEGVDALGKTQTLLNLIYSLLVQGKKCLVVSERSPALKRTQDMLAQSGLGQLHFLLDDALQDKTQMLELLRVAANGLGKHIAYDEQDFTFKKNKYLREKKRVDEAYEAVRKPVFGDHAWEEVVGLFLKNNREAGKELLASHLQRQNFEYEKEEHALIKQAVQISQPLFEQVKTLSHPLSKLNEKVFRQVSAEDGRDYVAEQLAIFTRKFSDLQRRYINETDGYRVSLENHYKEYGGHLETLYQAFREKILGYSDQYGDDFRHAGVSAIRIPFFYSSKKKKVVQAQQETARLYRELKQAFEAKAYFDFQFAGAKNGMQVEEVIESLKAFGTELDNWKSRLDAQISEEVLRLNSKTAHPSLGVKEQVTALEYALEVLIEELNEAELYQKPYANKTLTVPQRQKYLESILEQLEVTQLNLRDFPVFYQWQSNWLNAGPLAQKVIRALAKVRPANWLAAFESWYFHNLLTSCPQEKLPTDLSIVSQYEKAWHALKPLIIPRILHDWQQRQTEGIRELKRKDRQLHQLIYERQGHKRGEGLSLEAVLKGGFDSVTDFLPVLFVTPHIALNVLPQDYRFDYVIFDEANRFSVEKATDIAILGRKTTIFGSNDNNGSETSLLQYALENDVPAVSITNRYEAPIREVKDPALMMHNFYFAQEYFVENLEGRFHEQEGTNDVEAQHIIRLLNQIKQTPQRVYPSVGIVTFTVEQRNLIASYLLKLKQQNALGSEKIRQLERNGMGVFYIEELFGQQFDILVVSCTYGTMNLKGKLTKKIQFLNSPEGISHMHLLINQPVRQLYLMHSFSDEVIHDFTMRKWDEGAWLLGHFIKLAMAVRVGNEPEMLECLKVIGKKSPGKLPKPLFIQEVAHVLKAYIGSERLRIQEPAEDILLPMVIDPLYDGQPEMVVHPDGFFAGTAYTSGIWESRHRADLEESGYRYLPVWSVRWLKDPEQEGRRLASWVIKSDSAYKKEKGSGDEKEQEDPQEEEKRED